MGKNPGEVPQRGKNEFLTFVEYLTGTQDLLTFTLHILIHEIFVESAFQHGNFTFDHSIVSLYIYPSNRLLGSSFRPPESTFFQPLLEILDV